MAGSVVVFPLNDYPSGTHSMGERNVPGQISAVSFSILRCTSADPTIWPNVATSVEIILEVSEDGGVTWTEHGRMSDVGGIQTGRHGVGEVTETAGTWPFPQQSTVRARGTAIITNGPLRSQGTLSWA